MQPLGCEYRDAVEPTRRSVELPADIDQVWAALTSSDLFSQWFGEQVELDPRPGGRGSFRSDDGSERTAVVEVIDPPKLLVLRFHPFGRDASGRTKQTKGGYMRFALRRSESGTRLDIEDSTSLVLEFSGVAR